MHHNIAQIHIVISQYKNNISQTNNITKQPLSQASTSLSIFHKLYYITTYYYNIIISKSVLWS